MKGPLLRKRRRILVTGGAGFIGSNFVHHLLHTTEDLDVVVLDSLTYAGNLENLAHVADDPRYHFRLGDVCDMQAVLSAMQDCDWVVQFAAESHVDRSIIEPQTFVRTDVQGTFALLEAARTLAVSRFIEVSTDEVYGNAEGPDGSSRPSIEADALMPRSPYAASKAGADRLAYSYWATYGLPVIITRCSNNYGPYQYPEKQLPLFITNAQQNRPLPIYGDGSQTRDWIHVHDHVRALYQLLIAPDDRVLGETFNIGAAEERSVLDNARSVLALLGKPESLIVHVPDRLGHVRRHAVDATKLRQRIGWQPHIPFEDGLAQTIRWYEEHAQWMRRIRDRHDQFLEGALVLASEPADDQC